MASSPLKLTVIGAQAMSSAKVGDSVYAGDHDTAIAQIVWSSASHTDAVLKFQQSVDGTTWEDIASMTHTLNAASGGKILVIGAIYAPFIRANYAKGSNTTGTVNCYLFLKK